MVSRMSQNMRPTFTKKHYEFLADSIAREIAHYTSLGENNLMSLREGHLTKATNEVIALNLKRNIEAVATMSGYAQILASKLTADNDNFQAFSFFGRANIGAANLWVAEAEAFLVEFRSNTNV